MPDKIIDIPGVGQVSFPDSMADADIEKAAAKLYADNQPPASQAATEVPTSSPMPAIRWAAGAGIDIARAAGGAASPMIQKAAGAVANSPVAQRVIGRAAGAAAGTAGEAL